MIHIEGFSARRTHWRRAYASYILFYYWGRTRRKFIYQRSNINYRIVRWSHAMIYLLCLDPRFERFRVWMSTPETRRQWIMVQNFYAFVFLNNDCTRRTHTASIMPEFRQAFEMIFLPSAPDAYEKLFFTAFPDDIFSRFSSLSLTALSFSVSVDTNGCNLLQWVREEKRQQTDGNAAENFSMARKPEMKTRSASC